MAFWLSDSRSAVCVLSLQFSGLLADLQPDRKNEAYIPGTWALLASAAALGQFHR